MPLVASSPSGSSHTSSRPAPPRTQVKPPSLRRPSLEPLTETNTWRWPTSSEGCSTTGWRSKWPRAAQAGEFAEEPPRGFGAAGLGSWAVSPSLWWGAWLNLPWAVTQSVSRRLPQGRGRLSHSSQWAHGTSTGWGCSIPMGLIVNGPSHQGKALLAPCWEALSCHTVRILISFLENVFFKA